MSTTTISIPSTPIPISILPSASASASPQSSLDAALTSFLSTWSLTSTLLLLTTLAVILYPLFFTKDPDTHPFLLARQSVPSPIRQPGESAVYRALDVPHGYPLRHALGVRDQGAAKWSPGRVGDIRDVWRIAALGVVGEDGEHGGPKGGLVECLGREGLREVGVREVTGGINAVGEWVRAKGGKRVVVGLSNCVELLVCVFAAAFYDFPITLLPPNLSPEQTRDLLARANADILIAEAGVFDFDAAIPPSSSIKDAILVAKGGSKDIDWEDVMPKGINVSAWHNIVSTTASQDVPPLDKETKVRPISIASPIGDGDFELVEFTSQNIISGIAALNVTLTRDNKLSPTDILLPTSSLTDSYTLCWTLAALYVNATVALNSVAGENVDLALATASVKPTIIVAPPGTINKYVLDTIKSGGGPGALGRYFAGSSLRAGVMPVKRPTVALGSLSKLRLLLIGQSPAQRTRLSSSTLHELRMILGVRVAYALTAPKVAGAVCQTMIQDYRDQGEAVNMGPPLGSVEVHVTGAEEELGVSTPKGKLVVKGPSVSGGRAEVDVNVQVQSDHTLRLL